MDARLKPQPDDPIVGISYESLYHHAGPPAAVTITFQQRRLSGAVAGRIQVTVGDAMTETSLPELLASGLSDETAKQAIAADPRGDRATRLIAAVMQPAYVARLIEDLKAGGELDVE